jgi:hypothetical protein
VSAANLGHPARLVIAAATPFNTLASPPYQAAIATELEATKKAATAHEAAARRLEEQLEQEKAAAFSLQATAAKHQATVRELRAKVAVLMGSSPGSKASKAVAAEAAAAEAEAGGAEADASLEQRQREEGLSALLGRIMALEKENARLQVANQQLVTAAVAKGQQSPRAAQQQSQQLEQQAGLKPVKTQAAKGGSGPLGRVARESSAPGTPAAASGGPARPSTDGGTGLGATGAHSRPVGAGAGVSPRAAQEGRASGGTGSGASGGGGVSYAPAAWEESKALQAKVEGLRWVGLSQAGAFTSVISFDLYLQPTNTCRLHPHQIALPMSHCCSLAQKPSTSCRKRLAKKTEECEALKKDAERHTSLVASLQHDRERAAAALAAAKERLKRVTEEGAVAVAPVAWAADAAKVRAWVGRGQRSLGDGAGLSMFALWTCRHARMPFATSQPTPPSTPHPQTCAQLKDYVDEVLRLEGEKDALAAALQQAQRALSQQLEPGAGAGFGAPPPPGAAGSEAGAQLFEARLQRDQAHAAAHRLKLRLEELFGLGAADPGAQPGLQDRQRPQAGGRPRGTGPGGAGRLSAREAELLSTVDNLRAALERAMAGSTPTARFLQVGALSRRRRGGAWFICLGCVDLERPAL